MANWDRFVVTSLGRVIINGKKELDIIEFPNGRKYFLDKKVIINKEILTTLKSYTQEDLKKEDFIYPIYSQVGHEEDEKRGITARITDPKTLGEVIRQIEESML